MIKQPREKAKISLSSLGAPWKERIGDSILLTPRSFLQVSMTKILDLVKYGGLSFCHPHTLIYF